MRKLALKHTKVLSILLSAFVLVGSMNTNHVKDVVGNNENKYLGSDACGCIRALRKQYIVVPMVINEEKEIIKPVNEKIDKVFKVSAYTLAYQSCQKSRGSKDYGITSSGYDLKGHTLASARTIAVDPLIIKIGSKVKLTFLEDKYKKYNSIYIARDKGGGINGYEIDLFYGDFLFNKSALEFGVTKAHVEIIKGDN